ncbi:Metallothionein expression activator [Tolypocladium ophioglossoides CBS 100239]|uniref:Metallothionein expression activator n=1 Tax=Tolypocladium ophioglossoides (strain CBS 100239) TaxID=1163406 RepID=A0A0L0N367_TOLOC|nr:Metallothionein expression activator [Tolypocladium ophioglossoides CBS 100239]
MRKTAPEIVEQLRMRRSMAAMAEQPFPVFPHQHQHDNDNFARYPEPPQNAFTSPPMDMSIAAEAAFGPSFPRSGHDVFPTTTAMGGFEASLYAETPNYILNGRASPGSYHDDSDMRLPSSGLSTASMPSAPSSAIGSPQSNHGQLGTAPEWSAQGMTVQPSIVGNDYMTGTEYFSGAGMEDFGGFDFGAAQPKTFVDPSLIHHEIARPQMAISPYDGHFQHAANPFAASPSISSSPQPNLLRTSSTSPYLHNGAFQPTYATSPYGAPMDPNGRRVSMSNFISPGSADYQSGDETKEKQRCTYPDCGKVFKDLKAHMLTHQNERPEKCPIQTCEYHVKGFARKYDKNRHTLTHYKGTMVCGFCPGSGSPAEKSFNRADVFKRHLTAVHGVEQTPPNSRKKTPAGVGAGKKLTGYAPDATGKCSTCSQTFSNAQDFYEHLDDCVLRIVQQEDPAEAINARRLAEVENDKSVHQTLEKNNLPTTTQTTRTEEDEEDYEMGDEDEVDDASSKANSSPTSKKKTNPANGVQKSRGITHSRGGVPLATKARGRKNRRDYPSSWGFDKGQMTMKKRIMAVFDGPRRLAKDDMMLSTDHEVRIKLSDGKSYVTDLDVQTLKRAEGFLGGTDEEKGPWISDDPTDDQLKEMKEMLETSTASI